MKPETASHLLEINRRFYQDFAEDFHATRSRVQPGVAQVLADIPDHSTVLDIGCGNGSVCLALLERGFRGWYTGLDASRKLLKQAERAVGQLAIDIPHKPIFLHADLADPKWTSVIEGPYDRVFAFAVLHHIPAMYHLQILKAIRATLRHSERHPAVFVLSNWQFLRSPQWRARIQPWATVGLDSEDVDPNDYLLDWRRGGLGYRYLHHFEPEELDSLANAAGFQVADRFSSDGKEGNLAEYQTWVPLI